MNSKENYHIFVAKLNTELEVWTNKVNKKLKNRIEKAETSETPEYNFTCQICGLYLSSINDDNSFFNGDYVVSFIYKIHKPENGYRDEKNLCCWCFNAMRLHISPLDFNPDPQIYYKGNMTELCSSLRRIDFTLILLHLKKKYNFHEKWFGKYLSKFLIKENMYIYIVDHEYHKDDENIISFYRYYHLGERYWEYES